MLYIVTKEGKIKIALLFNMYFLISEMHSNCV